MRTVSILLQTLCVPCACRCRYCLLSWDGRISGADWERSKTYAARFAEWIGKSRPELRFSFSYGYSMEHPALPEALDFMRKLGSVSAEFLQCDGLRVRDGRETAAFVRMLRDHGVKHLNFTYYGLEAYHDRFAGRKGDFAWLRRLQAAAGEAGLKTSAGVPLNRENAGEAEALFELLGAEETRFFIPHAEGRGAQLEPIRLRIGDLERLSDSVRERLNRKIYRSEAEWLAEPPQEPEKRMLLLTLTRENIQWFEKQPFEEIVAWAEGLDDAYYAALPPWAELARLCGDPAGDALFGARDLTARYQKRWIRDHGLSLYDVTDERQTGSRRY